MKKLKRVRSEGIQNKAVFVNKRNREKKNQPHLWAMGIEQWASYQLKHDDTIRRLNCLWKKSKNRLK